MKGKVTFLFVFAMTLNIKVLILFFSFYVVYSEKETLIHR